MDWIARGLVGGVVVLAWLPASVAPILGSALGVYLYTAVGRQALLRGMLGASLGAGVFLAQVHEHRRMSDSLAGEQVLVGRVLAFPVAGELGTRFRLSAHASGKVDLFWPAPSPAIAAGDRVRVTVRLRAARGLANPGGFDSEAWAFSAGVIGGGYVLHGDVVGLDQTPFARLDRVRQRIADAVANAFPESSAAHALLPALAVADRRGLGDPEREVLRVTGTMHLLAISGLHIGLVAFAGGAVGSLLWPVFGMPRSRRGFACAIGVLAGSVYAGLAGFGIPTQRAIAMLAGSALVYWTRGRVTALRGLTMAAALILLLDPAAVASSGFWLSFGAVAMLALATLGWRGMNGRARVLRAQGAIFVGMRPMSGWLGVGGGWVAPLVNLVAIPWVGWLVVPMLLVGVLPSVFGYPFQDTVLAGAGAAVDLLWDLLVGVASLVPGGPAAVPGVAWGLMLAMTVPLLLLPLPNHARVVGVAVFVLGLAPRTGPPEGAVDLHVLDVGQGLAVLAEADGRTLLYDAGPRSLSGWSAGQGVVLPFLRRNGGTPRLDRVIISHGDLDHAGGWPAVRDAASIAHGPVSPSGERGETCRAGDRWRWGRAEFRILHPTPGLPDLGNDSSCVLLIEVDGRRILLPGDVSTAVEPRLARETGEVDVLLAAHHGSAGSSGAAFVTATRPRVVVFSHGYANRFGMPRPEIFERFAGARRLSTAACGYLQIRVSAAGVELLRAERAHRRRPWHPQREDDGVENQYDCATRAVGGPVRRPDRMPAAQAPFSSSHGA